MKITTLCSAAAALLIAAGVCNAQDRNVRWSASYQKVSSGVYDITVTGNIERGWHVYDTLHTALGPSPTELTYTVEGARNPEWVGGMTVNAPIHKSSYDEDFMTEVGYYENRVSFTRRLKVSKREKPTVKINVSWMECNEENCLPPADKTLTVSVK